MGEVEALKVRGRGRLRAAYGAGVGSALFGYAGGFVGFEVTYGGQGRAIGFLLGAAVGTLAGAGAAMRSNDSPRAGATTAALAGLAALFFVPALALVADWPPLQYVLVADFGDGAGMFSVPGALVAPTTLAAAVSAALARVAVVDLLEVYLLWPPSRRLLAPAAIMAVAVPIAAVVPAILDRLPRHGESPAERAFIDRDSKRFWEMDGFEWELSRMLRIAASGEGVAAATAAGDRRSAERLLDLLNRADDRSDGRFYHALAVVRRDGSTLADLRPPALDATGAPPETSAQPPPDSAPPTDWASIAEVRAVLDGRYPGPTLVGMRNIPPWVLLMATPIGDPASPVGAIVATMPLRSLQPYGVDAAYYGEDGALVLSTNSELFPVTLPDEEFANYRRTVAGAGGPVTATVGVGALPFDFLSLPSGEPIDDTALIPKGRLRDGRPLVMLVGYRDVPVRSTTGDVLLIGGLAVLALALLVALGLSNRAVLESMQPTERPRELSGV